MKIGSNSNPDTGRFQKRRRMYDLNMNESWVFRIVDGPVVSFQHMWPTIDEEKQTGVIKPTWKSACVRKDDTNVLDKLAEIDSMLKKKLADKNGTEAGKSVLRKSHTFNYACIFRNTGKPMAIEILEANWSVHEAIMEIRSKKDPTHPDFLMNGLTYMYDIVLEKVKHSLTGRPDYKVAVVVSTLGGISGKVGVQFLDAIKFPYPNAESFFSAEELDVINGCAWELADQYKALSIDEVQKMLEQYPLDLGRRVKLNPNQFMFFHGMEDLMAIQNVAKNQNIPVMMPNSQDLGALTGVVGQQQQLQQPTAQQALPNPNAVEAQYTVLPNQLVHPQPMQVQPGVQYQPQPQPQPVFAPAPTAAPAGPYAHTGAAERVLPFRENPAASTPAAMPQPLAHPDQAFTPPPAVGPAMPPGGQLSKPIWD